jgi:hypothetical protein
MALASASPATPPPAKQETIPPVAQPWRRNAPEVEDDVRAALPRLPARFTRREVCEVLGYDPDRGALYRVLQKLTMEGSLRVESRGEGQKGTVYRQTDGGDSPSPV